jgi:threonyl-tRNA synthetase
MIRIKLPDGSARELSDGASAFDLAKQIGPGLAKASVVAKVNDQLVDLHRPLPDGAEVALITKKAPEALEVLRHSAAHLMADAILRIYPKAS